MDNTVEVISRYTKTKTHLICQDGYKDWDVAKSKFLQAQSLYGKDSVSMVTNVEERTWVVVWLPLPEY